MTTAVHDSNLSVNHVRAVCSQQHRLLKKFESVSHYLGGIVASMWLPGRDATFDNPVKKPSFNRPVFLTLEVKDDGALSFSGAISRLRNDQFVFSVIFAYDVSIPFTRRGGGRVLPANNVVLARRANDLLAALVNVGRKIAFGEKTDFALPVFPEVICDARGTILEDYTPVLGLALRNPAKDLPTVEITRPNPAAKILAKHGLETAKGCDATLFSQIVAEFKAEFSTLDVDVQHVVKAIAEHDTATFSFPVPFVTALHAAPQDVVTAMRLQLPPKYRMDAGYSDLLQAAKHPDDDLRISRLSAVQIFPVEAAYDFPESYAGTVLPSNNWMPPSAVLNPEARTE